MAGQSAFPISGTYYQSVLSFSREVLPELVQKYRNEFQPAYFYEKALDGKFEVLNNRQFEAFEAGRVIPQILVASSVASGIAGGIITVTIAAASHTNDVSPVVQNMETMLPDTAGVWQPVICTQVTRVANADVAVFRPKLATTTLAALVLNDQIPWLTNATPTTGPAVEGYHSTIDQTIFYTDIVSQSYDLPIGVSQIQQYIMGPDESRTIAAAMGFVEPNGLVLKDIDDMQVRYLASIEHKILSNRRPTNAPITGANYLGFDGIIPSIQNNGGYVITLPPGAMSLNTFQTIESYLNINSGANEYNLDCSLTLNQTFRNFAGTNFPTRMPEFKSEEIVTPLTYRSFDSGDVVFNFRHLRSLDHPNALGVIPGIRNVAIALPAGEMDMKRMNYQTMTMENYNVGTVELRYRQQETVPGNVAFGSIQSVKGKAPWTVFWMTDGRIQAPGLYTKGIAFNCEIGLGMHALNRTFLLIQN